MKISVLSINVTCWPYLTFIERLRDFASRKKSAYICVANVHMTIEAHDDPAFADIVNDADAVTPDGMPLVAAIKLLADVRQERVTGMDLLPDLLKVAENEKFTVFFYGGTEAMLQTTDQYLSLHFPGITKKHFYSPPFRLLSTIEVNEDVERINETGANVVFVALGCPKQEKWMASMKGRIDALMIGIGGALPVMIGMQKRAPRWMQKTGMEWFFRFIQEPRRLFKRYAVTNSKFLWLMCKAWYKQGFRARKYTA